MAEKFIHTIFQERYQIQSLLGRQTGRRTFLAQDLQTQSQVVVKLLLFNPDFTWDDLKLFETEAETLKNIAHPAIPQYLDSFEVETELGKGSALVQSYIEAKSLQDWAESGRSFSEVELKDISTQLLAVLQYLHSRQPSVIHRDIKPSNILLTDRSGNSPGMVYLVDFGSVQTVIHSGTITIVGTYGYMPPEQFGGRTTPASDLYSLGATLIYLITRAHPADLPTRRGQIQFEANSQISPQFQAWIKSLIQPDLEERLNTAQQASLTLQNPTASLDESVEEKITKTQRNSPRIQQPLHTKCTINKSNNVMRITAPSTEFTNGGCATPFFGVIFIALCGIANTFVGMIGLILWFVFVCIALERSDLAIKSESKRRIIEIDKNKNTTAIYTEGQPKIYLSRFSLESIQDVQISYRSPYSSFYGVRLRTRHSKQLLVGDREFWLSKREAYWLANELGDWLQLPIVESEVINNS